MGATHLGCLLLLIIQTSVKAQIICSIVSDVKEIEENNEVGVTLFTITTQNDVTIDFTPPLLENNPFIIEGNLLKANRALDYEDQSFYSIPLTCLQETTAISNRINVFVRVLNVNDNPPVFAENTYRITVPEASPIDSSVARFVATDADKPAQLYYSLTSDTNYFKLQAPTQPNILIKNPIDYDKVKNVELVLSARDTPPGEEGGNMGSTTILVTISDSDNRPPWFQPCEKLELGGVVICPNEGYTGLLNLGEKVDGALPLKPGPLYAIDGDSGINGEVSYTIIRNVGDLFEINSMSGNISLKQPVNVLGPIVLTVVAAQVVNPNQYSTTTVTFDVSVNNANPPRFPKEEYTGFVLSDGGVVKDPTNGDASLEIFALDDDYAAAGGINPDIEYQIIGSENFTIADGLLFMKIPQPVGTVSLQVRAEDTVTGEDVTAPITVEVKPGKGPTYGPGDMAALGVTLGVLLLIALVVIGVLACRIQKGKADWRKIYEAIVFKGALTPGSGNKKGTQFTNHTFQSDEEKASDGGTIGRSTRYVEEPEKPVADIPHHEALAMASVPLHDLLDSTSNQSEPESAEKEVKPILTKERRVDDGYKAVWFKTDIDPSANEEVVIIPDSREDDHEEETSFSGREAEEDEQSPRNSRVAFADSDHDSGLGVRMEDPSDFRDDTELIESL